MLVVCMATKDVRDRILHDLLNIAFKVQPACSILLPPTNNSKLAQFILFKLS